MKVNDKIRTTVEYKQDVSYHDFLLLAVSREFLLLQPAMQFDLVHLKQLQPCFLDSLSLDPYSTAARPIYVGGVGRLAGAKLAGDLRHNDGRMQTLEELPW